MKGQSPEVKGGGSGMCRVCASDKEPKLKRGGKEGSAGTE